MHLYLFNSFIIILLGFLKGAKTDCVLSVFNLSPFVSNNVMVLPHLGKGFPDSSAGKESACNAAGPSLIPGLGRSSGEEIGYPLQYSWASLVAQRVKNPPAVWETWVPSLGLEDPLGRERLFTPVFWLGEFHGVYSPWACKELDTERLSLSALHYSMRASAVAALRLFSSCCCRL